MTDVPPTSPSTGPSTGASTRAVPWKLTAATIVGNTIEFYDFTIYGTLTALVFGRLFFPTSDPLAGTLLAFGTFAVGFVSRPLGGVLFGHLGDRLGRKPTLTWSLGVMGTATFLMGLLPTYADIGVWAPILLTFLRFCQGLGIGGEWGGAVSLMVESAPPSRRGWYGSLVQTGSGFGIILSSLTLTTLLATLGTGELLAWGWRIPFLVSVVLVGVGVVVRLQIQESPEFREVKAEERVERAPVWQTVREHPRTIALAIGMYVAIAAFGFVIGVFVISYTVQELGLSRELAVTANLVNGVFYVIGILVAGALSDRIGKRRTYLLCGLLLIPAPFLYFALLDTRSIPLILAGSVFVGLVSGLPYGVQAALFCELFPARLRYSGISLGFQVATVLGGALAPTVASLLFAAAEHSWAISAYIAGLAVIMVLCTLAVRPYPETTKGIDG
ncbi:MFS transporter [Nonomuraea diastatica]|uniref:Putative proline/betaine transporter n=1 Tax=Nonomuraea diastatica TaxID=1848329 RepID=A0A4R4WDH0_9ACTN|nr:MFS transporter [Nonomuraea diastatica]TDD16862.1 MFS transporter [Nonomuraea diastatica]